MVHFQTFNKTGDSLCSLTVWPISLIPIIMQHEILVFTTGSCCANHHRTILKEVL